MKDKLNATFGSDKLEHKENITYPQIHVIDLTRRTKGKKAMEIYDTKPEGIDTLLMENQGVNISATFFKPQCFMYETGKEPDNCEGVFYPTDSTDKTWLLFLEIKDCNRTNISQYFRKAKKQIVQIVQIFREKNVIAQNKDVYANISFPREKARFYNQLIKPGESKGFFDKYKIRIRGTNHLKIKNTTIIH